VDTITFTYPVDILSNLGGNNLASVGFAAGTGGAHALQTVTGFSYKEGAPPAYSMIVAGQNDRGREHPALKRAHWGDFRASRHGPGGGPFRRASATARTALNCSRSSVASLPWFSWHQQAARS
jgi:hypothetical protein